MEFEWDEHKNQKNKVKHGIGFEEAKEVFLDKNRLELKDDRKDYGEDRWKVIGIIFGVIITVIYTMRTTVYRIISARAASKKERAKYTNQDEWTDNQK
ncbi:MAG: BrnT family toxin [Lewinellaceae bacterium]|nr:BrnT family toxin [Lewinellaceae bacterium]